MKGFQCWFCGEAIDCADGGAIMITVESLWSWADGKRGKDDPTQSIYVHSRCAKERMAGATMQLEPSVFGERIEDRRLVVSGPSLCSP